MTTRRKFLGLAGLVAAAPAAMIKSVGGHRGGIQPKGLVEAGGSPFSSWVAEAEAAVQAMKEMEVEIRRRSLTR